MLNLIEIYNQYEIDNKSLHQLKGGRISRASVSSTLDIQPDGSIIDDSDDYDYTANVEIDNGKGR
jgi:hypothetical protein